MNPQVGLNAPSAAGMARPGNVAFLSQSGALCTAILDGATLRDGGNAGVPPTGYYEVSGLFGWTFSQ